MSFPFPGLGPVAPSRRRFIQGLAAGGAVAGLGLWPKPVWALKSLGQTKRARRHRVRPGHRRDAGELHRRHAPGDHRQRLAAGAAAALARGHHGQPARAQRAARGSIHGHETSIHWHGILLPANMDGVPGLSFNGIHRGETLPVPLRRPPERHLLVPQPFRDSRNRPACTAPIVIDAARSPSPSRYDRDYVVMLSRLDRPRTRRAVRAAEEDGRTTTTSTKRTVGDFCAMTQRDGPAADARRPQDVGRDAHDADRPVGRQRQHLHLPDERHDRAGQLDRPVPRPARRCGCASSTARR